MSGRSAPDAPVLVYPAGMVLIIMLATSLNLCLDIGVLVVDKTLKTCNRKVNRYLFFGKAINDVDDLAGIAWPMYMI